MACEQGKGVSDAGKSDSSGQDIGREADGRPGCVGVSNSSTAGGIGRSQSATTHEGNGGESVPLIDCSDPFWWGLVPCERVNDSKYD